MSFTGTKWRRITDLSAAKLSFSARLPFLIVAVLLGAATVCAAVVKLTEPGAISPWEPSISMEGVRLNAGLPIYEAGHATHMYGPLLTVLLAVIFRITGLNLPAARITMSILALVLSIFLASIFSRDKSAVWLGLSVLLFLGINLRTNLILLSSQADCVAALIACVALWIWIKHRASAGRCAVSIALFACAMLFKQTAAAFALIPIAFVLLWARPLRLRDLVVSTLPTLSILLVLGTIRWFMPQMFTAIVTVPASIKVYPIRALTIAAYLFATFPIALIALIALFSKQRGFDTRERWICAALVILIPASLWAISKSGGSYSSLLPAYLAMTALFVARLDVIRDWLGALPNRRAASGAIAVTLAILISVFIQFGRVTALLLNRYGDDKYDEAVAIARQLGAVAPQDPTIAYRANGYIGHSLFFELDTNAVNGNWPSELPISILREIGKTRHVISVQSYVPTPMFERALRDERFRPVPIAALRDSAYTLWTKDGE